MERARFIIQGKVQQVGFRYFCQREAIVLGLTGFAANRSDGSVIVEAQGEQEALENFRPIVRRGPRDAIVESVEETIVEPHASDAGFAIGNDRE